MGVSTALCLGLLSEGPVLPLHIKAPLAEGVWLNAEKNGSRIHSPGGCHNCLTPVKLPDSPTSGTAEIHHSHQSFTSVGFWLPGQESSRLPTCWPVLVSRLFYLPTHAWSSLGLFPTLHPASLFIAWDHHSWPCVPALWCVLIYDP